MQGVIDHPRTLRGAWRTKLFSVSHPRVVRTLRRVVEEHLTYLEMEALRDLVLVALENEARGIEGVIVEAGCAAGGSAIALASAKRPEREFFVFDVFGMIPPPSAKDGPDVHERYGTIVRGEAAGLGSRRYYGYEENLLETVQGSFAQFGLDLSERHVHLIPGLFEETLKMEAPVALAHIDCDWYESVRVCLERIVPKLVRGGTLVLDDYESWSGCRKAVEEYFRDPDPDAYLFVKKSRLHVIRR